MGIFTAGTLKLQETFAVDPTFIPQVMHWRNRDVSTVIPFPAHRRGATKAASVPGRVAQIYILPVVRIERHADASASAVPAMRMPRNPFGPFFSGGGRRAR